LVQQPQYSTEYTNVNPSLRRGWIELFSRYDWDWYCTFTPKDLPKSYTMVNRFTKFVHALQKEEEILVGYVMVTEWFKLRKCYHLHALLGNVAQASRSRWWHWWSYRYGRMTLEQYEADKGATSYLTKYVSKEVYDSSSVYIKNLHVVHKKG